MFGKVNVLSIISLHLGTLRSYREQRLMKRDFILFYGLPLVATLALLYFEKRLDNTVSANLIAAMSIFAGFLFNLLSILYSLADTVKKNLNEDKADEKERKLKRQLLQETHHNISYSILVSVLLIILLCVIYFLPKFVIVHPISSSNIRLDKTHVLGFFSLLIEGTTYFFLMNFALTLLMILQRVHALMKRRIAED